MTATATPGRNPHRRNDVGVHCFLGLRRFANEANIPYDRLRRWRLNGPVWIPDPVVAVGRWPGWPLPLIRSWTPDTIAGSGPVPLRWPQPTIEYADTTSMCRRYRVASAGLWSRIRDGEIPAPDVWVDDRPGWAIHQR
ncbi:hypothetical protein HLB23_32445 [Nocardia uniformis]|uniref:Uncharacterized protein n=1 Tax=Nocardia uniformis TaxID=53432 RepID=A0A849CDL1_9NOCA|nr:hypothetical protein [Nocardia uniformis]NNH74505.1 hypothetical protein [Nocardia uniformis]